jgi:hypothetical protein
LSNVINAAKRLYYDRLIADSENKMKVNWNIVRSVTGKRQRNKSFELVYINGTQTDNHQLIADIFQNYFLSITDKLTLRTSNNEELENNNSIDYLHRIFGNPFPNIIFENTTKEIKDIIKSLKSKNSFGFDKISVIILKISTPFIVAPLNYICNRSILSGTFPTQLKFSVVKPLFKQGDNKDIKKLSPHTAFNFFL